MLKIEDSILEEITHYIDSTPEVDFGYEPDGEFDVDSFVNDKPYWRTSKPGHTKRLKKFIITDWSYRYKIGNGDRKFPIYFWELMLQQGVELYVWTGKPTRVKTLLELKSALKNVELVTHQHLTTVLPQYNISRDEMEIVDYLRRQEMCYQLKHLFENKYIGLPELNFRFFKKLDTNKLNDLFETMDRTIEFEAFVVGEADLKFLSDLPSCYRDNVYEIHLGTINLDLIRNLAARPFNHVKKLGITQSTITRNILYELLNLFPSLNDIFLSYCGFMVDTFSELPELTNLKSIEISGPHISDEQLNKLLLRCPNLAYLCLVNCDKILGTFTDKVDLKKLQKVYLGTLEINDQGIHALLRGSQELTSLYFRDLCSVDGSFVDGLDFSKLNNLDISSCAITDDQLGKLLQYSPQLTKLSLSRCMNITGAFSKKISQSKIDEIKLESIEMKEEGLRTLLQSCPLLSKFTDSNEENNLQIQEILDHCHELSYLSLSHKKNLHDLFSKPLIPNKLKEIYFCSSNVKLHQVYQILKNSPQLTSLSLSSCENLHESLDHIQETFVLANLVSLDLSYTMITDDQLHWLLQHCPNLTSLDLSGCKNITGSFALSLRFDKLSALNMGSAKQLTNTNLSTILQNCPHLKKLKIQQCEQLTDDFFSSSKKHESLEQLDIKFNKFSNINTDQIKKCFPNLVKLEDGPYFSVYRKPTLIDFWIRIKQSANLDTETSNPKEALHARQLFTYKKNGYPKPSQYRLKIHTDIEVGETVKYKTVVPIIVSQTNILASDKNIKSIYDSTYADSEDIFHGKFMLPQPLEANEWIPLPSLSSQDIIVDFACSIDLELGYCEEEKLLYVSSRKKITEPISISFLIQSTPQTVYDQKLMYDYVKGLRFSLDGHLENNFAYRNIMNLSIPERTATLVQFCQQMTPGVTHIETNTSEIQKLNALVMQNKGLCRHKSLLFMALAKELGINAHAISNDCHEFVEISRDDNTWQTIDLGGGVGDLKILPLDESPHEEKKPETLTLSPNNPFITWDTAKSNAKNVDEYFHHLITEAMTLPEHERNILVALDKDQIEDFHSNLTRYFHKIKKQTFYLNTLGDVSEKTATVTDQDELQEQDSHLIQFVKQAKAGDALITNWSDYKSAFVGYNTIMDEERKLKTTDIPPGVMTIALLDKAKANKLSEDFYSRCRLTSDYPGFPRAAREELEADAPFHKIEFYDNDWKAVLLGQIQIKGKQYKFAEAELAQAIAKKSPGLLLQNAPWHLVEFRLFMEELLQKKSVIINGKSYALGENFQIRSINEPYVLNNDQLQVLSKEENHLFDYALNSETYPYFFKYYTCQDKQLYLKSGWIAERDKVEHTNLSLLVTETLTPSQWARLLKTAKENGCILKLTLAPGVTLPEAIMHKPPKFDEEPLNQQVKVIVTNNLDLCEEENFEKNALVISINHKTRFGDLFESIKQLPSSTKKDLLFESHISDVWKKLESGKTVILKGSLSPLLAKRMETLFLSPPFIWMNGEKKIVKGKLLIITDTKNILSFSHPIQKNYSEADFWLALEKKYQDHPLYEDFKKSALSLQEKAQIKFDYSQLDTMLAKIKAGNLSNPFKPFFRLRPDLKLALGKSHWTKKRIKPLLHDVEEKRHNKITAELEHSPYIFITGPSGVGKSTYILDKLRNESKTHVTIGINNIENWFNTPKDERSILFIDEANIEKAGSWDMLEGLFNKTPGILRDGQYHPLTSHHKVIFAGNFSHFAGRHEHAFFDKHGQVFNFKEFPDHFLEKKFISPGLNSISYLKDEDKKMITDIFLKIYHKLNTDLPNHPLTSRNLKTMCMRLQLLFNVFAKADNTIQSLVYMAVMDEVGGLLNQEQKIAFKSWLKGNALLFEDDRRKMRKQLEQSMPDQFNKFIVTPSRKNTLRLLRDHILLRDMKLSTPSLASFDVPGILIEGAPGEGKSSMVLSYLREQHFKNGFITPFTPDSPSSKRYYHLTPTDPAKMESILIKAFHEGAVVMIDELNSLPLERIINQLLSGTDPAGNKPQHKGFMIIATQNPVNLSGRQVLSDALQNRFRKINLAEYPPHELADLAQKICPDKQLREKTLADYLDARQFAIRNKKIPLPTPRNLFIRLNHLAGKLKNTVHTSSPLSAQKFYSDQNKESLVQRQLDFVI